MKKAPLFLILALAAIGCGGPRYQIVSAGDDRAYRLDTKTGEVLYIIDNGSIPVMPAKFEAKP